MKKIVSYIFIFLLSIPILVGLGHFVIDERHEICSDFTTHFHEKELDCFSCDYNRNQIEYTRTTFYFDEIIVFWAAMSIRDCIYPAKLILVWVNIMGDSHQVGSTIPSSENTSFQR